MHSRYTLILLALLGWLALTPATDVLAATETDVRVQLHNGGVLEGRLVSHRPNVIVIQTTSGGNVTLPTSSVARIEPMSLDGDTPTPTPTPAGPLFQVVEPEPSPTATNTMPPGDFTLVLLDGTEVIRRVIGETQETFVLSDKAAVDKGRLSSFVRPSGEQVTLRPVEPRPEGESSLSLPLLSVPPPQPQVAMTGGQPADPIPAMAQGGRTQAGIVGRLTGRIGNVGLRLPNGAVRELQLGEEIRAGDTIVASEGRGKIELVNRTDFRVRENSVVELQDAENARLERGRVWAKVQGSGAHINHLQVTTPNCIAGVRGTLFYVDADPAQQRDAVSVFEGKVFVQWAQQSAVAMDLTSQQVRASPAGLSTPVQADPNELNEWRFWDEWQADVDRLAQGFLVGGQIISAMGRQIADEQRAFEAISEDANENIRRARTDEDMEIIWNGLLRYRQDMGVWPPEDDPWTPLFTNQGGAWNGPYLPEGRNNKWRVSPFFDQWRNNYHFVIDGPDQARLISNGPNKRYEQGGGDDYVWPR